MSGSPMLSAHCHAVNTLGTRNVVAACLQRGREAGGARLSLLYLSTYNVVFGGQEILGGDEAAPYFQGTHSDQYAPSKTLAEKAVLEVLLRGGMVGSELIQWHCDDCVSYDA